VSGAGALERLERARAAALVAPAALFTLVFFLAPFAYVAALSLWTRAPQGIEATWTLANYADFFGRASLRAGLVNSLEIAATVTALSLLIAYPFAWFLAMVVPERWRRLALALAILPFWTSYVVRSYAWFLLLAQNGALNQGLLGAGLVEAPLALANSRTATVIGFTHFFVMLCTLTIYATLVQLPPNLARAAADLGASGLRTFVHVILPLSLPGVAVGGFLTFVLSIGDYITPQILGGGAELTLPQIIMLQIGRRADFPAAAAQAIVLMAVVALAYLACARWLRVERG
jgi:spermidine/putrescine transport system permease protein